MVIARTIPTMLAVLSSCDTLGGVAGGGTEGDISSSIIVMEEVKVTEVVVSVEEVTTGLGGGDVEVSRGATVDVSITVAAHANRYRSDNA